MSPLGALALATLLFGLNFYGLVADYRNHPQLKLWFRLLILSESGIGILAIIGAISYGLAP